jgi:hypothetical protein
VTIESLEETALSRIQECAPRAMADFKPSVRPIYGSPDGRRLTHIGSCLLLKIDDRLERHISPTIWPSRHWLWADS